MTDRELFKMALDMILAAIKSGDWKVDGACDPDFVINALRARLAQPEQEPEPEPVAWKDAPSKIYLQVCNENDCDQPFDSHIEVSWCQDKINDSDVAYVRADTAPPQREWVGLTAKDLAEIPPSCYEGAIWADAKLKEKNT